MPNTYGGKNKATKLQQPYQEDRARIIGEFLFEKCNMEEKKEILYQIWKRRREK